MTDKTKIINLVSKIKEEETKEKQQFKTELNNLISDLQAAIDEERLTQIVIQWEEVIPEEDIKETDTEYDSATSFLQWNKEGCLDKALGFAQRLANRIFFISEGS